MNITTPDLYVKSPTLLTDTCPPRCRELEEKAKSMDAANMEAFVAEHKDQVEECMKLCAPTDPTPVNLLFYGNKPGYCAKTGMWFWKKTGWKYKGSTYSSSPIQQFCKANGMTQANRAGRGYFCTKCPNACSVWVSSTLYTNECYK
jgi:hypothetical protein